MSKILDGDMTIALTDATTYLARIWRLELKNGDVYRFTDTNADLVYGGEVYEHDPGVNVSSVESTLNSNGDNAQITITASPKFLSKLQIRQGVMDGASFELWLVDHRDPDKYGLIEVFAGSVVDVSYHDKGKAEIQLNSNIDGNNPKYIGDRYSRLCRAVLGDAKCKFDLESVKNEILITTVEDVGYSFTSSQLEGHAYDGYFDFGRVEFITGENAGFSYEVKSSTTADGKVILSNTPRAPLAPGDALWIWPGCDKQLATCRDKFSNLPNYRGEPYALTSNQFIVQAMTTDFAGNDDIYMEWN
jgi:uncharacterized phage protein (TIGR02218 family)